MVSKNQPDWLPSGWKLQIKVKNARKFKCYVHSKTSLKVYSRLAVFRCIKNGSVANDSSNATEEHVKKKIKKETQLVAANDSMKWLPAGWDEEVKIRQSGCAKGTTYKCFTDPSSGSKFYSKPEVLRYLQSTQKSQNSAGPSGCEERQSTKHSSSNRLIDQHKSQESNVKQKMSHDSITTPSRILSSGKKERPVDQRLPQESKIEQNVLQKSNATASRRLSLRNKERPVEQQKAQESNVKPNLSQNTMTTPNMIFSSGKKKVVIENTVDEDLPSGWIKEMRKKFNGTQTRTDPFYFHPASGLVFRSKREVLRYLNTGEISRHAYWRKVDKEDCPIEKTSMTPSVKRETTTKRKTRNDLFAGEETSKVSPSSTAKTRVVKEATVGRITRSSSRLSPASVSEAKPNHRSLFTRNDLFAGEETPKVSPSSTLETRVVKETNAGRTTRSSSGLGPASVSEAKPNHSSLFKETPKVGPSSTPKTRFVKEATVGRSTRSSSRLGPASVSEAKPNHSSLCTKSDIFAGEETPKVSPLSTPKTRVVKEATAGRMTRSSSRLGPASVSEAKPNHSSLFTRNDLFAGDETPKGSPSTPETRFVKISTVGRTTRSSSRLGPVSVSEAKPKQSSSFHKTADISEESIRTKTKDHKMTPSTPAMSELKVENAMNVSMKVCSNKRKTNDQKNLTMPSRSSKRLAGVDVQPVFLSIPIEHALQPTTKKFKEAKPVTKFISVSNDLQEKPNPPDPDMHKVSVCQQTKQCTLDASFETVLATEEPSKNSNILLQSSPPVVPENAMIDLPPMEEPLKTSDSLLQNSPPVVPENAVINVPPTEEPLKTSDSLLQSAPPVVPENAVINIPLHTEQPLEISRNHAVVKDQQEPFLGTKIPKSSPVPVPEELRVSTGTNNEQSGTEFTFPLPLWSDPCLEFAYKTLTGAIPLDDNLAFEDYIQHQRHTSKPHDEFQSLPDIDMPSFLQNDDTKHGQLSDIDISDGVRLANGNVVSPSTKGAGE